MPFDFSKYSYGEKCSRTSPEALLLPPEARAALIDSLLASLDVEIDEDAEAACRDEIQKRIAEIDAGAARLLRWDDAKRALLA